MTEHVARDRFTVVLGSHWTGFTIGYDIVKDYRDRHPQVSWPTLTAMSAAAILAGSHYQPCPP